jgi:hypothetical protein
LLGPSEAAAALAQVSRNEVEHRDVPLTATWNTHVIFVSRIFSAEVL